MELTDKAVTLQSVEEPSFPSWLASSPPAACCAFHHNSTASSQFGFLRMSIFFISCTLALVLFAAWCAYWRGFPQFSDVGLL